MNEWKVIPCFSGEACWCRIIVSPDGDECNGYGEITKGVCDAIVDALNNNQDLLREPIFKRFPLPWIAETMGRFTVIGPLNKEHDDHYIGFIFPEYADLFVSTVNAFYNY